MQRSKEPWRKTGAVGKYFQTKINTRVQCKICLDYILHSKWVLIYTDILKAKHSREVFCQSLVLLGLVEWLLLASPVLCCLRNTVLMVQMAGDINDWSRISFPLWGQGIFHCLPLFQFFQLTSGGGGQFSGFRAKLYGWSQIYHRGLSKNPNIPNVIMLLTCTSGKTSNGLKIPVTSVSWKNVGRLLSAK